MNPKHEAIKARKNPVKGLNEAFGAKYDAKKNARTLKKGKKYAIKHF